jgi:hypothetical protein
MVNCIGGYKGCLGDFDCDLDRDRDREREWDLRERSRGPGFDGECDRRLDGEGVLEVFKGELLRTACASLAGCGGGVGAVIVVLDKECECE